MKQSMKLWLRLLMLLLISQHLYAQRSSVINPPSPTRQSINEARFTGLQRQLSSSASDQATPWLSRRKEHSMSPTQVKSIGDNTALYGCMVFSQKWTQDKLDYGMYSLPIKSGFEFAPIKVDKLFKANAAVYARDKYYLFNVEQAFGMVAYIACTVVKTDTWEVENIFTPPTEWNNVPYSSSLSYDPESGKIYGITFTNEGGMALSTLNTADGTFTKVCDVERPYIALAASSTGTLYGIADTGQLYTIDKSNGKSEYIGETGLTPKYAQGLTFDPNTNLLYWAYMEEEKSGLYQVNTQTATAYKIDDMPNLEEMIGLYILKDSIHAQAPARVTELKFEPASAGATVGKLSCVAPQTAAGGSALTHDVQVTIFCGDEVLLQETVHPGAKVEKDNVSFDQESLYTIYAQASNEHGSSSKSTLTTYIGTDIAAAPLDVQLAINDQKASLTWKAPQKGLRDGYINPASLRYNIMRYDGSDTGVSVAQTEVGASSFTEDIPSATAKYRYSVTSVSDKGDGGTSYSNEVLSVGAYELPFYDNFSNGELCNQLYTFIDVDQDGHDNTCMWFWKEDEKLMQYCSDKQHQGNDWLITPAIHLDAKNLYNLTFNVNMGAPSNLKVTIGTSPNPADHQTILDLNGIHDPWKTEYHASVKVPKDSIYYVGFYNYNDPESFYFNLFDVKVEKGIETALPDSVANLSVIPAENGEVSAKISFKAPRLRLNGHDMPELFDMLIYRDNELVKTIPVSPGQQVDDVDKPAQDGEYTYQVMARINGKEGLPVSRKVWVGHDISEPVRDLKAMTIDNNLHVKLTWAQPEKGVHGGYFNRDEVTYSVWRSLDAKNFVQVATSLKKLNYTDSQIEKELAGAQDAFYYAVTADTKSGSSEVEPIFIVVGKPHDFPVSESFPDGQFNIRPWTIKAINGYFSWECIRDDVEGGVYSQDQDNGMTKFYNIAGDNEVDSRLISPAICLKKAQKPMFSFFMFHWLDSTVESDNHATKVVIEVAPENGEFEVVSDTITAAYPVYGWVEHRIPLAPYKEYSHIKIGLRGSTDNDWMYYYVDNIHIDEQYEEDLAISELNGPTETHVNDTCYYSVKYFNRGLKEVDDYKINLYQDGTLVNSLAGEPITPGEIKEIEIPSLIYSTKAGEECDYYAEIAFSADQEPGNNRSGHAYTKVKDSWYPGVEHVTAESNQNDIVIDWEAPVLPTADQATVEGVEGYDAFILDYIGNWITYDGDGLGAGKLTGLPEFPNTGKNQAFQVWNPSLLEGVTPEAYPHLQPRSGNQCFVSWYANVSIDGATPYNNDYLISPEVKGGTDVSFYIQRINPNLTGETYEIMYSSTTQEPDQFKKIVEKEAPADWEKVSVTLPDDARYFAIRYTASLKTGILVDDISYTSGLYALKVSGYNIFRNGLKLNSDLLTETTYIDHDLPDGKYGYQVSVLYNRGESKASFPIYVGHHTGGLEDLKADSDSGVKFIVDGNKLTISTLNPGEVVIYSIDGKTIHSGILQDTHTYYLPAGVYMVTINGMNKKIIIQG